MPEPLDHLQNLLVSLSAGARRHAARNASARARLARACAERVADAADDWARAAVSMKQGGAVALAEEMATGPLATLRLLLITARSLERIAAGHLPRATRSPRLAQTTARLDRHPMDREGTAAAGSIARQKARAGLLCGQREECFAGRGLRAREYS